LNAEPYGFCVGVGLGDGLGVGGAGVGDGLGLGVGGAGVGDGLGVGVGGAGVGDGLGVGVGGIGLGDGVGLGVTIGVGVGVAGTAGRCSCQPNAFCCHTFCVKKVSSPIAISTAISGRVAAAMSP